MSIFDAVGPEASSIVLLWWILLGISAVVFIGVVFFLCLAIFRKKVQQSPEEDKAVSKGFYSAIAVTVFFLIIIVIATLEQSTPNPPKNFKGMMIEVTGKQWWWEVKYYHENGTMLFETANEIHIPEDTPIKLRLLTDNVIHSFWVPNIAGKVDMIPGRINEMILESNEPGTYRGQCAEYCGIQHTLMAFLVIVDKKKEFQSWVERQQRPAVQPVEKLAKRGQEVFVKSNCVKCHSVKGFSEALKEGPDLTHFMDRKTLASATLPNRKGHLTGWISDPQGIKPGNLMPFTPLHPEEFHALIKYLEVLK